MEKILVTGSCGFIGMHLCLSLLKKGYDLFGIDSMNNYYDVELKNQRLKILKAYKNFNFTRGNISSWQKLKVVFEDFRPCKVVNLAAQAGVRHSLKNPSAYIDSNIKGFMNILEACRHYNTKNLVYASSSSVYGLSEKSIFSINDRTDQPISIYGASKKSNELMAHAYSHLFGLHTTGLRLFTVYGPWGRPDMAMYIFAEKIINGEIISIFNNGDMYRDFTYVDDIVDGIEKCLRKNFKNKIFNLGNHRSESLMNMVALIEEGLGKKAKINFMDMQPGDVQKTHAGIKYSRQKLNYNPKTNIKDGIPKFLEWFKYYKKNYS